MEGPDISSAMTWTWNAVAASECRLTLMEELKKLSIGFADIEEFNLGLNTKLKSSYYKGREMTDDRLIKVAMEIKLEDEILYNNELKSKRNGLRKQLEKWHVKNSKPYRSVIKTLKIEAAKLKIETKVKFEEKLQHLREKYKNEEDDILR